MKERKSLQQLAGADPWVCPKCGCRDFRTINSYLCKDGTRHRRQYCRHCKYVRMTYETSQKVN